MGKIPSADRICKLREHFLFDATKYTVSQKTTLM